MDYWSSNWKDVNYGMKLKWNSYLYWTKKRALRGWGLAYQAFSIVLPHQSQTLDPALKASGARRFLAIQLLIKDP